MKNISVVKCIIEENKKILLIRENATSSWRPHTWGLPGGKFEEKEDYKKAITREMKEETGIEVTIDKLLEIEEIVAEIEGEIRLVHHFIFQVVKQMHADIGAELKWFTKDELLEIPLEEYAEFYYKDLFERYFSRKLIYPSLQVWDMFTNNALAHWVHEYKTR